MNIFTIQKHRNQTYGYQRGQVGGSDKLGNGNNTYTLIYVKWITNRDLLHSTGTLLNIP